MPPQTRMIRKHRTFLGLLSLAAAVVGTGVWMTSASAMGRSKARTYEVTVTNLTRGQVVSPPLAVVHSSDMAPLWTLGSVASDGLAAIAEDADTSILETALDGADGVVVVGKGAGPIPPGQSGTVTLEARGGRNLVSLAAMLVQTNDTFVGSLAVELPKRKGRPLVVVSPGYDAGSEANNEDGDFIPGPPFGSGGVRATEGAEGFVHVSSGVAGIADLDVATYDWRNPAVQITITRID